MAGGGPTDSGAGRTWDYLPARGDRARSACVRRRLLLHHRGHHQQEFPADVVAVGHRALPRSLRRRFGQRGGGQFQAGRDGVILFIQDRVSAGRCPARRGDAANDRARQRPGVGGALSGDLFAHGAAMLGGGRQPHHQGRGAGTRDSRPRGYYGRHLGAPALCAGAGGIEPKTIWTKLYLVPVTLSTDQPSMPFTHVIEDMTVPMPSSEDLGRYVIYVGFDPRGAPEENPRSRSADKSPARADRRTRQGAFRRRRTGRATAAPPAAGNRPHHPGGGGT